MTEQWIPLLIQVPLVGVFIWYSLKMSDQMGESQVKFLDALDNRDAAFERRTKALVDTMNANTQAILGTLARMEAAVAAHDDLVREKLPAPRTRRVKSEGSSL